MPAGRKPNEGTPIRHGVKPAHEWVVVDDVPYTGPKPKIPTFHYQANRKGELVEFPMPKTTKAWWNAVSTMPHCVLWSTSDWQFALDTLNVHAQAMTGKTGAMAELRMREKIMGTTLDSRRDLRIKYARQEEIAPVIQLVRDAPDRKAKLLDA
jgi:hypothetical protein